MTVQMTNKLKLLTDYINIREKIKNEFNIEEYSLSNEITIIDSAQVIEVSMNQCIMSFKIEYLDKKNYLRGLVSINKEYNTDKWKIVYNSYPYKINLITVEENCLFINYAGKLTCFVFEENDINFNKLKIELMI